MILNSLLLVCLLIISIWQAVAINRQKAMINSIMHWIDGLNTMLPELIESAYKRDANILNGIQELCSIGNAALKKHGEYVGYSTFAIRNFAICLIPLIDEIKMDALEDEDYERAQECMQLLENLKQISKIQ